MFERFTRSARHVVRQAVIVADARDDGQVVPADLLRAILTDHDGAAARVLVAAGVDPDALGSEVERRRSATVAGLGEADAEALALLGIDLDVVLRRLGGPSPGPRRRAWGGPFGTAAKQALRGSLDEAVALRHSRIGPEHLLLGLLRAGDPVVVDALAACGASYGDLRDGVRAEVRRAG